MPFKICNQCLFNYLWRQAPGIGSNGDLLEESLGSTGMGHWRKRPVAPTCLRDFCELSFPRFMSQIVHWSMRIDLKIEITCFIFIFSCTGNRERRSVQTRQLREQQETIQVWGCRDVLKKVEFDVIRLACFRGRVLRIGEILKKTVNPLVFKPNFGNCIILLDASFSLLEGGREMQISILWERTQF